MAQRPRPTTIEEQVEQMAEDISVLRAAVAELRRQVANLASASN